MPTFMSQCIIAKKKDDIEVFQAGKRLSGSVCECVCGFGVVGGISKRSGGSNLGTRRSERVK